MTPALALVCKVSTKLLRTRHWRIAIFCFWKGNVGTNRLEDKNEGVCLLLTGLRKITILLLGSR